MKVRATRKLPFEKIENILIRGTNWIGDVVMTLPAVSAVRKTFSGAKITVLAKPWVAEIYRICPDVDDVIIFQSPGPHDGIAGKIRLARLLRSKRFDMAVLLQNAIEAAIIMLLAGIPIRAGYNSDGRGLLLTHSVRRTAKIRTVHQVYYYIEMLKSLGFRSHEGAVKIKVPDDYLSAAKNVLDKYGVKKGDTVVGIAPGAAYGPAKMWFSERFASVADRLSDDFSAKIILFGSAKDGEKTNDIVRHAKNDLIDIAGKTSLREVIALIAGCDLFISNDSGLMHLAGALDVPLVAIFGSTNPVTTSPVGEKSVIIYKNVSCGPCLKKVCPTDFKCMDMISAEEVYDTAKRILESKKADGK